MSLNIRLNGQTVSLKEFTTSSPEYNLCPIKIPYRKDGNTYYALAQETQSNTAPMGVVGSLAYYGNNTDPTMKMYKNGKTYFFYTTNSTSSRFFYGKYTKTDKFNSLSRPNGQNDGNVIRFTNAPVRASFNNLESILLYGFKTEHKYAYYSDGGHSYYQHFIYFYTSSDLSTYNSICDGAPVEGSFKNFSINIDFLDIAFY